MILTAFFLYQVHIFIYMPVRNKWRRRQDKTL